MAKQLLAASSHVAERVVVVVAEQAVSALSIEEKERLLKIRSKVDNTTVQKIVSEADRDLIEHVVAAATPVGSDSSMKLVSQRTEVKTPVATGLPTFDGKVAEEWLQAELERRLALASAAAEAKKDAEAITSEAISDDKLSVPAATNTDGGASEEAEPTNTSTSSATAASAEGEIHPILGKSLGRYGNRSLYMMNVQMLKNIPVWEKQRVYRKERAKKIADSYLSKNREADEPITIPGTIAIYEKGWETPKYHLEALREVGSVNVERSKRQQTNKVKESLKEARSRYGIIDGQHRVGAMRHLHNEGKFDEPILVEVFSLKHEDEVSELFLDINKAEPVKDVDLPGAASTHDREILLSAVTALQFQFPAFFKESTKCRKPNLNADNFRDALFQSKVIERRKIKTDEDLVNYLLQKNAELSERTDMEWAAFAPSPTAPSKAFMNQIAKAREGGFFLGLVNDWE